MRDTPTSSATALPPPAKPPVRPRARLFPAGETHPLDDLIESLLDHDTKGIVNLYGPHGSGKSVALAHLAARFSENKLFLLDETQWGAAAELLDGRLIVATSLRRVTHATIAIEMAPWDQDDQIEYLLHKHHAQCKSVMRRLATAENLDALGGSPWLWAIVLDALAADETLQDAHLVLREFLVRHLEEWRFPASQQCFEEIVDAPKRNAPALPRHIEVLLHHRVMKILLAGDYLALQISRKQLEHLHGKLPADLLRQTARDLPGYPGAKETLIEVMKHIKAIQPMGASLLLSADPKWRPVAPLTNLTGAQLSKANWRDVNLKRSILAGANFFQADLAIAKLRDANATRATFRHALLNGADLVQLTAKEADFSLAGLAYCVANFASFEQATLTGATLNKAHMVGARFERADLTDAKCTETKLEGASFIRTILENTDLSNADCTKAWFHNVDLRPAILQNTTFRKARFLECNLEGISLTAANFQDADFTKCYLTASIMPNANFQNASLRNCGLAEVQWPNADLRNVDFSHASFHMGSSRSGLVHSTLASEGTRTGFYTDDYNDQDFKAPEEIRKANLCGCDLRGAKVEDADFYLVDLRGAQYTPDQAAHFRRCGAILRSRAG